MIYVRIFAKSQNALETRPGNFLPTRRRQALRRQPRVSRPQHLHHDGVHAHAPSLPDEAQGTVAAGASAGRRARAGARRAAPARDGRDVLTVDEGPVAQDHCAEGAHGQDQHAVLDRAPQAMRGVAQRVVGHLGVKIVKHLFDARGGHPCACYRRCDGVHGGDRPRIMSRARCLGVECSACRRACERASVDRAAAVNSESRNGETRLSARERLVSSNAVMEAGEFFRFQFGASLALDA